MVWFSNGGLKTGQKMSVLWLKKMSGFQIVRLFFVIRPFKNRTKKDLKSLMFGFQMLGIHWYDVVS